jgi:ABC-type transport system involved in multi-copper enzyme maturation permease subunit
MTTSFFVLGDQLSLDVAPWSTLATDTVIVMIESEALINQPRHLTRVALYLSAMRSFAEERRSGTLAALLTTPASPAAVVWAKFLSVWVVWMVFWLLFTIFPLLVEIQLGKPGDHRLSDPSILWGGICFVAVSGLMHASIGILCSCVTRSSALAALLAFISLLALTAAGGAMESLPVESWEWLGWLREPAAHLRTFAHLQDFASGILDSRPIILYATGTLLCLGLANLAIEDQE